MPATAVGVLPTATNILYLYVTNRLIFTWLALGHVLRGSSSWYNDMQLVFPFPDVYFYSREYGNGSSHSRDSRAPGNDVYYEGLMTKNLLTTTCCTQVLLLIFINCKEVEKQRNYVGKVVSYPQWQVHITVHSAQAVMSVVRSECLRNGGPDEKLEQKNTWSRLP